MANIIQTHKYEDGSTIGWDTEAEGGKGGWVPLDTAMQEGSFLGNVGRGAVVGANQITQGVSDLLIDDYASQQRGAAQQEQQARAERTAPWATGIGSTVPDVLAGIAAAPLTGGMSVPGMLATEFGVGAATGFLRPGTVEERVGRAVIGGGLNAGGAVVAQPIAQGVGAAVRAFRGVESNTLARIGQASNAAAATIREADTAVAGGGADVAANIPARELAARQAEAGRFSTAIADLEAQLPAGQRSVGAAETPAGESRGLDALQASEEQIMKETDQAGAALDSPEFNRALQHAQQLGWTPPIGQNTRAFSTARMAQEARNYMPFGDVLEQSAKAGNQALVVRHAAKAMGEEGWQKIQRIDDLIPFSEARIGRDFQSVESRLPSIDAAEYAKGLSSLKLTQGAFQHTEAQKLVNDAIAALKQRGVLSGEEIMADRKFLSARMSKFYREGDTDNGELLMEAINKLDGVLDREIKRNKYKTGLAEKWAGARQQWQILSMVKHGASADNHGGINAVSLWRQLRKDRSSGGFSRAGPEQPGAARELFDLVRVAADAESGVPKTGALNLLLKQGTRLGVSGLGLGAVGHTIWGGN